MERSRRELSIDMVIDTDIFNNNLIMLFTCIYLRALNRCGTTFKRGWFLLCRSSKYHVGVFSFRLEILSFFVLGFNAVLI